MTRIIFTGINKKIGSICWDMCDGMDRANYSRSTDWNLDWPDRVDELLEEDFDIIVSVAKTNQYYLIQQFFEKYKDSDKRLIVFGSRASEWSGKQIPHHGMKYAIDKKSVYDAVRFIQNYADKSCIAQILNVGKADSIEHNLGKHFKYILDNPEIQEISLWGTQ